MEALALQSRYHREVDRLARVRATGEHALAADALRRTDLDHLYESTFLAAVAAFEVFLEGLFFSCLAGRSGIRTARPLIRFQSLSQAEAAVPALQRSAFLRWLDWDELSGRASLFLHAGRPFSRLRHRSADRGLLKRVRVVRNAIAHRSRRARTDFLGILPATTAPAHRTTAAYLQSAVGGETQHGLVLTELKRLASGLAALTDDRARQYLAVEDDIDSGGRPGRGTYECVSCGRVERLRSKEHRLLACPKCSIVCLTCGRARQTKYRRA